MGPEAGCINNRCRCLDGTTFLGNRCYAPILLAGKCNFSEECILGTNELTYCEPALEVCICVPVAFQWERSCHEKLLLGGRCRADVQCQLSIEGFSHCDALTSTCVCTIRKHTFLNICSGGVINFANMFFLCFSCFLLLLY